MSIGKKGRIIKQGMAVDAPGRRPSRQQGQTGIWSSASVCIMPDDHTEMSGRRI